MMNQAPLDTPICLAGKQTQGILLLPFQHAHRPSSLLRTTAPQYCPKHGQGWGVTGVTAGT